MNPADDTIQDLAAWRIRDTRRVNCPILELSTERVYIKLRAGSLSVARSLEDDSMPKRALLVIDVQNVYTNPDSELHCKGAGHTIDRINDVIADAKRRGDVIVAVRHVHRADGTDLGRMFDFSGEPEEDFNFKEGTDEVEYDSRLKLPPKYLQVTKARYSAFVGTDLDAKLRTHHVDSVTICGFMTNFCCEGTARQAHDLDYFVDFVADATGTPGTEKQTQAELRVRVADALQAGYARTWTTRRWCARP